MSLQTSPHGEGADKERSIPLAEGHTYQSPRAAAGPALQLVSGSPVSQGVQSNVSSEALEYSENARLVGGSALSDDGMTPLITPSRTRKEKLLLFCKRLLGFAASHWSKAVIAGVLITLIVLVSVKGFGFFGDVLTWFQSHNGWAGWGIFVGMYTGVVALFLPGVVLILGAGFVFGFWRGLLAVWAGGAVGQALAFLLARYLLHDWVESTVKRKWARWAIIDKAIEQDGWKLVLIMRFSPIIPYNLLNIAMATTNIPFWQFSLVSAVGIVYECAVFAYFGSMADNIHSIISGEGGRPPWFEWVMLGVSLVMCVVGALFVSYSIKQAVKRAQTHMSAAQLESLGLGLDGEGLGDPELGAARVDGSYPAALEREGFVGSSAPHAALRAPQPASPEYELKAVGSGGAREKAPLLGGAGGSGLLALTAASGSGGIHSLLAAAGGGAAAKRKVSPKASLDRDLSRRLTAGLDGGADGGGEDGGEAPPSRATRRHPSISSETL